MSLRRQNGFTLVELMVTVAVLAILSTIAYPSFQSTIRSNRVATTTNELIASLALARSEAIKNTHGGAVCASTAGKECDGSSWTDGWMVWEDRNGNGSLDSGENVLRYSEGRPTMKSATETLTIGFDGRGRNRANAEVDVTLRPEKCGDQPLQRTLRISPTGQVRLLKESCS
ncbi:MULTISPECIES: GspH/FimT family pseudopilin [Stenotrophomonas]|uniref:GspH/FimT family pseudopilin n=1 Tax=Stenotrophomonas TaxID=40323 RepID=UPI00066AB607|nr:MULTISPECIES: Tfp pilus assembly protein FimT/FimU [Stenotrophomonas]MBH1817045.1 Tfp pilus assembly protein FimT/FimU [Stenotrophomonas maltophilia]MBN5158402.1 Tfp pilus assembly protein FimT/FimU [Stenotrophomonas maltophilia]MCU1031087.1 Tfp pilus assembly protein FimT/FimU [Stenotrophomonas maltophilia]MDG9842318.1 Tfp pilus assembly protein FimT/FimU [Stenotrophomonas sp. GD04054]MDH0016323.1 Tfp pilus assembly protein FimT/FimU [Stenotrophomonas sp. GD04028]